MEITLRVINREDKWYAMGIIRDITHRKNEERLMREEADRTNRCFEELKEGAYATSVEKGILLNANVSVAELLDYKNVNEAIGRETKQGETNYLPK